MAAKQIIEAVRDQLITANLVRKPSVAGVKPPCWIEPRNGVPAPGEIADGGKDTEVGPTIVTGLYIAPGIPQDPFVASTIRHTVVNIELRVKKSVDAFTLADDIRGALNDKVNWNMGGLQIIDSLIFRELQVIERTEQAFTYDLAYGFHHYV